MTRHGLTGSRADLAASCLFWARPEVAAAWPSDDSDEARLGSAFHEAAALTVAGVLPSLRSIAGQRLTDAQVDELRDLFAAWLSWCAAYAATLGAGGAAQRAKSDLEARAARICEAKAVIAASQQDLVRAMCALGGVS